MQDARTDRTRQSAGWSGILYNLLIICELLTGALFLVIGGVMRSSDNPASSAMFGIGAGWLCTALGTHLARRKRESSPPSGGPSAPGAADVTSDVKPRHQ
jgi:hypothetical protein